MNDVGIWREIAELFQHYGGWPVALACAEVARRLHKGREEDRRERDKEKDVAHERLLAMSIQQAEVMRKTSDNQAALVRALQKTQGAHDASL